MFSEGGDNHSRTAERELSRLLEETDVQIYAIASSESWSLRMRSPEEFAGPDWLDRLRDRAGGPHFQADSQRTFARAAEQIGLELRSQYVLGYLPQGDAGDGRVHHVRGEVTRSANVPKGMFFLAARVSRSERLRPLAPARS